MGEFNVEALSATDVTKVGARWSAGTLIFHESTSLADTVNLLTLATDAITVGNASNDVDFVWLGDTTGTFTLNAGVHTLVMTGLATTTSGDVVISSGYGLNIGSATQMTISDGDGSTNLIPEVQALGVGAAFAGGALAIATFNTTNTRAVSPKLALVKGGAATQVATTAVADNEVLGSIIAYGSDGTDFESPGGAIEFVIQGTPGTGQMPGSIEFYTTAAAGETLTLAVTMNADQTTSFSGAPLPATTNTQALGSATVMWADLFLGSAAVINFNNSNVTLTHSAGLLTMAGGGLTMGASGTPAGDVTLWGTTALYKVWFDVNGDTNGAWYFGADDYGVDVELFGQTTGYYTLWDASANSLIYIGDLATNQSSGSHAAINVTQTVSGNVDCSGTYMMLPIFSYLNFEGHASSTAWSSTGPATALGGWIGTDDTDGIAQSNGHMCAGWLTVGMGQNFVSSSVAFTCGLLMHSNTHASATMVGNNYSAIRVMTNSGKLNWITAMDIQGCTYFAKFADDAAMADADGNAAIAKNPDGYIAILVGNELQYIWTYTNIS